MEEDSSPTSIGGPLVAAATEGSGARGCWEIHAYPSKKELTLSVKQRHLDDFEQLAALLKGPFFVNKYSPEGDKLEVNVTHTTTTPVNEDASIRGGDNWKLSIDLSRNFFTIIDIDQHIYLLYDLFCSIRKASSSLSSSPDDDPGLSYIGSCLKTMNLISPQAFANQVVSICLTSNVLQEPVHFTTLKYEGLEQLSLNQNHMRALTTHQHLSDFAPNLTYLDLKHNRFTTLKNLREYLGPGLRLQTLLLSCNFLEDNLNDVPSYLPPESKDLRCLGLFSNLLDGRMPYETTYMSLVTDLANLYPNIIEVSLGGNPILFNIKYDDFVSMTKSAFRHLKRLDGIPI